MKVAVYWNLHKRTFSLQHRESDLYGRLAGHADLVILENCRPNIRERSRQRVILERRKNVHAFLVGDTRITDLASFDVSKAESRGIITYDPYLDKGFVIDNRVPFTGADMVRCSTVGGHPFLEYFNWSHNELV